MKTLEDKQAELRLKNYKRLGKKISKPTKPKGKWRGGDVYTFERCLYEYRKEFNEIVDIVLSTCRSQTKMLPDNKGLQHLSQRILYLYPHIDTRTLEREDIEGELLKIWWIAWERCRAKGWSLKSNFLKYAYWFLPKFIGHHVTPIYKSNIDELSYDLDLVKPFELDLNYVLHGSAEFPASLFNKKERYLIFLHQEYPNEYTRIGRIMRISSDQVEYILEELQERIIKELGYASKDAARLSKRGITLSA